MATAMATEMRMEVGTVPVATEMVDTVMAARKVSVHIDASQFSFHFSSIFSSLSCPVTSSARPQAKEAQKVVAFVGCLIGGHHYHR